MRFFLSIDLFTKGVLDIKCLPVFNHKKLTFAKLSLSMRYVAVAHIRLVSNQSVHGKYNLISVRFNKISRCSPFCWKHFKINGKMLTFLLRSLGASESDASRLPPANNETTSTLPPGLCQRDALAILRTVQTNKLWPSPIILHSAYP